MLTTRLKEVNARQATRTQVTEVTRAVLDSLALLKGMAAEFEAGKGTLALIDAGTKHALLQLDAVKGEQRKTQRRLDKMRRSTAEAQGHAILEPSLDAFYADFEDRFRGTREDIKSRVQTYVPLVEEAYRATGKAPVLDVGCGRGEWLEVMSERGIAAKGVDSNGAMIARCREMGLDVVASDGVEHIASLEANTLGAVTGFHLIEHMPFHEIVTLFQEALRVLKPGGVVVFESPNPENILVGSRNFWYDPTHVKPLPPQIIQHLAEASGFERAEIKRLHPFPEWELIPEGSDEPLRTRLNSLLYGAQDYSIIAYKP
jgi:O-antigen chain-terminating methyltransferase